MHNIPIHSWVVGIEIFGDQKAFDTAEPLDATILAAQYRHIGAYSVLH